MDRIISDTEKDIITTELVGNYLKIKVFDMGTESGTSIDLTTNELKQIIKIAKRDGFI